MKIGIVAPSCTLDPAIPDRMNALVVQHYPDNAPSLIFHPQCFLADGHFAGPDAARVSAFVEMANDPAIDAIWFARGGYGANRIAGAIIPQLNDAAHNKTYLGYSDGGFLLAALYRNAIGQVAHGPMIADIKRSGGEEAVLRGLDWLVTRDVSLTLRPSISGKLAAFNMTVFASLLGTDLEPDLTDHILMLEDVDEYMYRLDRTLFNITETASVRRVKGIMLGRCDPIPENTTDFGRDEEHVIRDWCARSAIPYLGRADIGHDVDNKVVVFG
jgi:muramoyltetrapeptide carboxypeptidase